MESYGIIYKATNLVNGKVYIGQTTWSLRIRKNGHLTGNKNRSNNRFKNAILKYGKTAFEWQEIDNAINQDELNEKEIFWISKYDSTNIKVGYNTNPGGRNYGRMPDEIRRKLSDSKMGSKPTTLGMKHSIETIEKIRLSKVGKKRKPFTKPALENMRKCQLGRIVTPEHARKISLATTGKPKEYAKRPVVNLSTGEIFPSVNLAAEAINGKNTSISHCCRNPGKKTRGFLWAYWHEPPATGRPSSPEADPEAVAKDGGDHS